VIEHPERPGETLLERFNLDFVVKGNLHPEGRKGIEASECAT